MYIHIHYIKLKHQIWLSLFQKNIYKIMVVIKQKRKTFEKKRKNNKYYCNYIKCTITINNIILIKL